MSVFRGLLIALALALFVWALIITIFVAVVKA